MQHLKTVLTLARSAIPLNRARSQNGARPREARTVLLCLLRQIGTEIVKWAWRLLKIRDLTPSMRAHSKTHGGSSRERPPIAPTSPWQSCPTRWPPPKKNAYPNGAIWHGQYCWSDLKTSTLSMTIRHISVVSAGS